MSTVSKQKVNGVEYDIMDNGARELIREIVTGLAKDVKMITPSPSDYSNKLSKVTENGVFAVTNSTGWEDLPDANFNGVIVNYVYLSGAAMQIAYQYATSQRRVLYRFVNPTTGAVQGMDWQRVDGYDCMQLITPSPSDYSNKISKVPKTGMFPISVGATWEDLPEDNFGGVIVNHVYGDGTAMQIAYQFATKLRSVYIRFVNPTTGAVYGMDWQRIDGYDNAHVGTLAAADYDGSLAKVTAQIKTAIASSTGWSDYPPGETAGIFIPIKYATDTMIQVFVSYPSMKSYIRVVQYQQAKTDWKALGGGSNDVVWYAIGDSITSGSYSNDQGEGVVAQNAEWAYPNRIGRTYGCVVHNLGVPGAAITEYASQLALVEDDATIVTITGGANDYYGEDTPLGTHESAAGNTTVCGAIKAAIESVASTAPNARIVLISPFIIKYGSASTKWSMNYAGRAGFTYAQLADAMKDIAEDYNIEFIDGTRNGPVNILNIGDAQKDNVHPTKEFYKTIANWIGSKLF